MANINVFYKFNTGVLVQLTSLQIGATKGISNKRTLIILEGKYLIWQKKPVIYISYTTGTEIYLH
jgi:hypothetical protein